MQNVAITKHAVDRFMERVEGAEGFCEKSIRDQIHRIVAEGYCLGVVRDHPLVTNRRVIPFKSGDTVLFLSIGPNTTDFDAEVAVIGVLYEKEMTEGRVGLGVKLGDLFPDLHANVTTTNKPRFLLFIGPVGTTIERYYIKDEIELRDVIRNRAAKPGEVSLYELID